MSFKMNTFLKLFIFINFAIVVLGIELCTENNDDKVIVGMSQSNIIIGCNTTSSFKHCYLLTNKKGCTDKICNDTRLSFNGDQQNFLCQFELRELHPSGTYYLKE